MKNALALAGRYRKAIVGFLAPGVVLIAGPLVLGNVPSDGDWRKALGAMLLAGFGVGLVSNKP